MGQEFKKSSVCVAVKVGNLFHKQKNIVGCLLVDRVDEATHYDTSEKSELHWLNQTLDFLKTCNLKDISFVEINKEITYKDGVKIEDYKWGE